MTPDPPDKPASAARMTSMTQLATSTLWVVAARWALRSIGVVVRIVAWSLALWAAGIGTFWVSIEAVVPGGSLLEASFALTAVAFGVALPSSPGFIGVFQFIGQQALAAPFPDRYTDANALVIAILNHAAFYIPNSLLGFIGLARLGLSLRSVRRSVAAPEATAAPSGPTSAA